MNGWNLTEQYKEVKEGTPVDFEYIYSGDKKVVATSTSCGCTTAGLANGVLKVRYRGDTVSAHLRSKGHQDFTKHVTVTYSDGTKDVLKFTVRCLIS